VEKIVDQESTQVNMGETKPTQDHVERLRSPDHEVLPNKHIGVDEELRKYVVAADSVQVDEATSKRLRHMINKRVLIVMVGTYFLQSLDKNAISYAAIMGIREDAHLVGQDVRIKVFLQLPRSMLIALVLMVTHGYLLWYLIRRISDQYHCAKGSYWEVPRGEYLSMGLDLDYDLLRIQFQNLSRAASFARYFRGRFSTHIPASVFDVVQT
jgi:hypothetical protein